MAVTDASPVHFNNAMQSATPGLMDKAGANNVLNKWDDAFRRPLFYKRSDREFDFSNVFLF